MVQITDVKQQGLAARHGVAAGDLLLTINGHCIRDVLDYRFFLAEKNVVLELSRDGKPLTVTITKLTYDDIGLAFATPLMDEKQSCANRCVFCFIDQLPGGMRESLYFKDDDSRLSFLHGNYITLTNLTDADVDRIIEMHLSPINVSIHTTDPDLRVKMMRNKNAGKVLVYLRRFADAGLTLCGQVVLCRGLNDGEALDRTMRDLVAYLPALSSVSIVPVGLTRYRENLYPLELFSPAECGEVIDQVEAFGNECLEKYGSRLFFCADEFYIKAERPLPDGDFYEGYPQIENGVGMLTSFEEEFEDELAALREEPQPLPGRERRVTVATGVASYLFMQSLCERAEAVFPHLHAHVVPIVNHFFGETITVSGLLTGHDMSEQLAGKDPGDEVLIPASTLRAGGDLFLDDMTPEGLSRALGGVPIRPVENDGGAFLRALVGGSNV